MVDLDPLVDVAGDEDSFVAVPAEQNDRFRRVSLLLPLAVATLEGTEPGALSPVWDSVDSDRLDTFVGSADTETELCIGFAYEGYDVCIRPGPRIALRAQE